MEERADVPVRVRRISGELRDLRQQSRLSAEEVAGALGFSLTKLSRIENGRRGLAVNDVSALLGLYRVPSPRRDRLLEAVSNGRDRNWSQLTDGHGHLPPEWDDFLYFESRATHVATFQTSFVPGLVQIPEYTAAILAADLESPAAHIDTVVKQRAARQANWLRRGTPHLHAVIEESVCRRRLGGTDVLRTQLRHVLDLVGGGRLSVQVVPETVAAHPALSGPFTHLRFDGEPDLLYVEYRDGCSFFEEKNRVALASRTVRWLRDHALDVPESVRLLRHYADTLS